jgi:mycofactocin system transcriptional regulator
MEIAAAAKIARRTFFRYFPSKLDVVWGDFDGELDRLRATCAEIPAGTPLMEAIRIAVIEFNRIAPEQIDEHRQRMSYIFTVPSLQANSALRFAQWRAVIADYAAARLGLRAPEDLLPSLIGHGALAAALAAYEHWLRDGKSDLTALLDEAFRELASGFSGRFAR